MIGNSSQSAVVTRDLRSALVEATFLQDRLAKLQESVQALNAEVEYLRGERAATVAWLRRQGGRSAWTLTDAIERGEHRREEAK